MRAETILWCFFAVLLAVFPGAVQGAEAPKAVANLPLDEVLRLYRQAENRAEPAEPAAPTAATVDGMELSGRLLDGALDISGSFRVSVLNDGRWVKIPLLKLGVGSHLAQVPRLERGVLLVDDGQLVLLCREQGRYDFDLAWVEDAHRDGGQRRVDIQLEPATVARLTVQHDSGLFELKPGFVSLGAEGAVYFPKKGRMQVAWSRSELGEEEARPERKAERPPVEPIVQRAQVSMVATLQGRRIVRAMYELHFTGREEIVCRLPEGQRLRRVHLNGLPMAFEAEGREVKLQVAPRRAGDESARLELLLDGQGEDFLLSGRQDFMLPALSWGVNQLEVSLHLPRVFNYSWAGGSLSPAQGLATATFSHRIPTPGKRLGFRQQLVQGQASLRVDYAVDLQGHYFDGRHPRSAAQAAPVAAPPPAPVAAAAGPVESASAWVEE